MSIITKFIPNAFTLANLFFGILGIFHAFDRNWSSVLLMLGLSLFMDVLDGAAARLLRVSGEIGKQLDSLADVVSFGVLPAITLFFLMREQCEPLSIYQQLMPLGALILALATAYRLAKFNVDTRQTDFFYGLPSPAQAIASVGLVFWANDIADFFRNFGMNPAVFYLLFVLALSAAMIYEIRLPAFKSLKYPSARVVMALSVIAGIGLYIWFVSQSSIKSGNFLLEGFKSLTPAVLLYLVMGALFFRPETKS